MGQVEDTTIANTCNSCIIRDQRVKVTPEDKKEILERLEAWNTQEMIAEEFGLKQPQVSTILNGFTHNSDFAKMCNGFEPYLYNIWNLQKAEHRCGELLREQARNPGERDIVKGDAVLPLEKPKLSDIGISKKQGDTEVLWKRGQIACGKLPQVFQGYIGRSDTHTHISHKANKHKGIIPGFGLLGLSMCDSAKMLVVRQPNKLME